MEEHFVRRLPGSPEDFQEVQTTAMKVVWKTSWKSCSALYFRRLTKDFQEVQTTSRKSRRLPGSPDDFQEVQTTETEVVWKTS
ncbi:hypothetical protein DY000_02035073 [Brassica cretica]|uniref:Uncharacterized protein n=1 Tax=Brassica cretica TaxID=69181 RepID=A0ABQ7DTN7_BRACR|nr:hypothetical protein DY000_02035073 [Brassica cretica]